LAFKVFRSARSDAVLVASTISPELRPQCRHAQRRPGISCIDSPMACRPIRPASTVAKLALNPVLRLYVDERLAGTVAARNGVVVHGPAMPWSGRRHGQRKGRRWGKVWSPEQIARPLAVDFPNDETIQIIHEAIYQALFIQGRGTLRLELTACLRTGRALRTPRAREGQRARASCHPRS
jgi:hypothetical protein